MLTSFNTFFFAQLAVRAFMHRRDNACSMQVPPRLDAYDPCYHSRVGIRGLYVSNRPTRLNDKLHYRRKRTNIRLDKTLPYFAKLQRKKTKSCAFALDFYEEIIHLAFGLINYHRLEI